LLVRGWCHHGGVLWSPETAARPPAVLLFGALASADKCLFARSGRHAETHPDDEASWLEFLRRHTTGARSS